MLSDDGRRCALPDPGQYELLDAAAARLLVRMAVFLQRGDAMFSPKKAALNQELAQLIGSSLPPDRIARDLETAWAAAESKAPAPAGELLRAWLTKAAALGLSIPDAFFGVAKMMHSIDAATRDLGLTDVLAQEFRDLYVEQSGLPQVLKGPSLTLAKMWANW